MPPVEFQPNPDYVHKPSTTAANLFQPDPIRSLIQNLKSLFHRFPRCCLGSFYAVCNLEGHHRALASKTAAVRPVCG